MKILLVTPLYPPEIGGPATYAKLLHDKLPTYGHTVTILPFSVVRHLPMGIRHLFLLVKIIYRGWYADVIFAQDVFSVGFPSLLVTKLLGKPFIVRVPGDFAWEQSRQRYGVTDSIDVFQTKKYSWRIEFYKKIERMVVRGADRVMTPSDYFSNLVQGWMRNGTARTVYNGVSVTDIQKTKRILPKDFSIISAGRMVPWKGFRELIEGVKKNPTWTLTLVGDGPDRTSLEAYARQINVSDRVRFLGTLSQEKMFEVIAAQSVFVLNSSFESFSYQLVEAMALGVPVVVRGGSNIEEIVTDRVSGIVVRPDQDIIQVLQTLDHSVLETVAQGGMRRANDFDISRTMGQVTAICTDMVHIQSKIIFLGTDRTVFDQTSRAFARLCTYGALADRVMFIIPTLASMKYMTIHEGNISFIPTNSRSKMWYLWDLFWMSMRERKGLTIISPQDASFLGAVALKVSWCTSARLYVQMHTDLFSKYYTRTFKQHIERLIARVIIRHADRIRVVSHMVGEHIKRFTKKPITIIPIYTIDRSPVLREKKNATCTFFTLSRLEPEKNIEGVLKAFKNVEITFPGTRLVVAGDGSLRKNIEDLAKNLGIKNVTFPGWVQDPAEFEADVFVQHSWFEGYGLSLVEALLSGYPALSTNVGVAPEYIVPGANGFLFEPGDTSALETHMRTLCSTPDLVMAMKKELQKHPPKLSYTSSDEYMKALIDFYAY